MTGEIWVLGATGRVGRAVAARLHAAGVALVLAGRDRERLEKVAAGLGGTPRVHAGSLDWALAGLATARPVVVVNTVGPFPGTAPRVVGACPPGTHYVDVANELQAVQAIVDRDREAADTGRVLVTGAGFGVLATESVLLRVCEGRPPASRVRVDAMASIATEPGVIGSALAGSIVDGIVSGGREVRNRHLARSRLAAAPVRLTTPDGETVTTVSIPSGELLAAWRNSRADSVVGATSMVPASAVARLVLLAAPPMFRVPGVSGLAAGRLARVRVPARERPRPFSWAHARAEWPDGTVREGWFRAGEAMAFTAAVMAEVARRLAGGEGRPGAYTPGALFGPELAIAAGGEFVGVTPG